MLLEVQLSETGSADRGSGAAAAPEMGSNIPHCREGAAEHWLREGQQPSALAVLHRWGSTGKKPKKKKKVRDRILVKNEESLHTP